MPLDHDFVIPKPGVWQSVSGAAIGILIPGAIAAIIWIVSLTLGHALLYGGFGAAP